MALTIGLTGGIASGKSTVSGMLQTMGLVVIDADVIAKEVVEIGEEAYEEIVRTFGEDVLLPNRAINRQKLGSLIFHNQSLREQLNKIVHPAVRKKMIQEKEEYFKKGIETVVLDIPLLFESKLTYLVDKTLLVYVDPKVQLTRLMMRNNLSESEALARISSQMPIDQKVSMSDAVLNNNGSIDQTKAQLLDLIAKWEIVVK